MLYAAQYRDMNTALHNLVIFSKYQLALEFVAHVEAIEHFPEEGVFFPIAQMEINFRNPPKECLGHRLLIVNHAGVKPDCY